MYALVSALLAGIITLFFGLTGTVTLWWALLLIGVGSWIVLYFVLKVIASLLNGGSIGEGISDGIGDFGDFDGGSSCGSGGGGGCGSGGGGD